MKLVPAFALALLALSACEKPAPPKTPPQKPAADAARPAAPAADASLDPASSAAAARVVETYYALIDDGQYPSAWSLWSNGGKASGFDAAAFGHQFDGYESYDVNVGAGDQMEGAAGSSYIDIPIRLEAVRKDGSEEHSSGSVTLRRVNNVDGAPPDQLQWRIYRIDLQDAD
jgi:hypothetical protein